MSKISVVFMFSVVLLMACNKETPVIPPLPPDQTSPTLAFEFVSVASTISFIPFGDTLSDLLINKGYQIQISDTTEKVLTACSGIVTAILPDTANAHGNIITVKFNRNSIYTFIYGGVTNVQVNVNDSLQGGSILGKVTGTGVVDFQVIKNNNTAVCPSGYGSVGFNNAIQQAIVFNNSSHHSDSVINPCQATSLPY
jgi:hypothetical protein